MTICCWAALFGSVNENKPCPKVWSQAGRQVGNRTYLRLALLSWGSGPPVTSGACRRDFYSKRLATTRLPQLWFCLLLLSLWNRPSFVKLPTWTAIDPILTNYPLEHFLPISSILSSSSCSSVYSFLSAVLLPLLAATLSLISGNVYKRKSFEFFTRLKPTHYPLDRSTYLQPYITRSNLFIYHLVKIRVLLLLLLTQ